MQPVLQSDLAKDCTLIVSLLYLTLDLFQTWKGFDSCPSPIHKWTLGSYLIIMVSRMLSTIASKLSSKKAAAVLLNLRQKNAKLRLMVNLTWWVSVPLMVMWSVSGTIFTWRVITEAPNCMPSGLHFVFLILWQVMCYAWIAIYCSLGTMALLVERRLQQTERDLREIADDDVEQRWGPVSELQGYASLPQRMATKGMTPSAIRSLPGQSLCTVELAEQGQDCSICLNALQLGETVRILGGCSHTFHRSCVDLWLLRSSECPLCKVTVVSPEGCL